MSERNRHDRGAPLALALILGAVVLVAGISTFGELLSQPVAQPNASNEEQHYEDADFHIWGDSWAQWAMAAFAVVATGVSWRGLYLLRRTFEETKRTADAATDTNTTARLALEADQRPWLVLDVEAMRGFVHDGHFYADISIVAKNVGKSPGIRAAFDSLTWPVEGVVDTEKWRSEFIEKVEATEGTNAIFQGIVTTDTPFKLIHKMVVPLDRVTRSKIQDLPPRYLLMAACGVSYRSVFEEHPRYSMKFGVLTLTEYPVNPGTGEGGPQIFFSSLSGGDFMT